MRQIFFLLGVSLSLFSADLKTLIDLAKTNELATAYQLQLESANRDSTATKTAYLPKIELGYSHTTVDKKNLGEAGETNVGYAKASFVLFDGFKRYNAIKSSSLMVESARNDYNYYKKSLALNVTELFFSIKSKEKKLEAKKQEFKQLQAEVERLSKFYNSGTASQDQLESIKAALALSQFELANIQGNLDELKFTLFTLVGKEIESYDNSNFNIPSKELAYNREDLKSIEKQVEALNASANIELGGYLPTVVIENTYSTYDFKDDAEPYKSARLDNQNQLTLQVKITEFDFFSNYNKSESKRYKKLALQNQLQYKEKEANRDLKLAFINLDTAKQSFKAASLRVKAANSSYELIHKKRMAGLASNVEYLDALTNKYDAIAMEESSKNTLEIAKARIFFYQGKSLTENLQ